MRPEKDGSSASCCSSDAMIHRRVRRAAAIRPTNCGVLQRVAGEKAEAEKGELGVADTGPASRAARAETRNARALRRSWARLIKRIYEVDPLLCPSCGGAMKVIAFITEHEVVDAILRHLERGEATEARGPPRRSELAAVS
jgi:hypothetical protein